MKGHFKTGYDQRELVLDITVKEQMSVGDLVKIDADNALVKATDVSDAQYIVAQSDMTMFSHVPVEIGDYRYSKNVAASGTEKKVAVFAIKDVNDIITG